MSIKVLLALVLAAAVSPAAFPDDNLCCTHGGAFEFEIHSGVRMGPALYNGNWSGCRIFGGWKNEAKDNSGKVVRSFRIVDGQDSTVLSGCVRSDIRRDPEQDRSVVTLSWDFTAEKDFNGHGLFIEWTLPSGRFIPAEDVPGCKASTVKIGTKEIPLPRTKDERGFLGGGNANEVSISDYVGPLASISIGRHVWCGLQDNRKWNLDTFSLRISVAGDHIRKGERHSLKMKLYGVSALGESTPVISRSESWIPMKDTTDVREGSALDFSKLGWIDAPAGKYGRVIVKDGHFEFERQPGVKQRFYGVNLCFTANYMSEADADELCRRLACHGYNALRIHHYESDLCDAKDGTTIRPEKMSQLDNLLNACIRHGLYLTTDLFVSRRIPWRSCGIDRDGTVPCNDFKELVRYHEGAFGNFLEFTRQLLTHVNPKTGCRWADEPAFAFLALVNEGNAGNCGNKFAIKLPEAGAAWKKWLAEHKESDPETYGKITDRVPENAWENSPQNCAYTLFQTDAEIAFVERMTDFIRNEIKSRVLLTDLSSWRNPVHFQLAREKLDYVDNHFYVDHPRFIERQWKLPSRCQNENPVRGKNLGFQDVAKVRLLDRPFTLTEFNYAAPGRFRGVGGLLLGAQAALQGYDGVWRFTWSHTAAGLLAPQRMAYFDVANDPLQRATERVLTMLYMRGDVSPLAETRELAYSAKGLRSDFSINPMSVPEGINLGWYYRLGTAAGEGGSGTNDFRRLTDGRRPGDGQVVIDRASGMFGVNTPRTVGLFAESDRWTVGPLSAAITRSPAAVWVSSLDGAAVVDSKRLLFAHVTDVQDEGIQFADFARTTLIEWGNLPHLMSAGTAEVELAFSEPLPCRVYALRADGSRRGEVPVKTDGGKVRFTADVSRDGDDATCFYEITRGL